MFLMRRNHSDFKALTQMLAMDQDKLKDYIKNQMEQQYGRRYAQKVEDRLLDYLCQLEAVLPRQTYIGTLLQMDHPLSEEERRLLHVIGCDCSTMAAAVHTLLHTGVGSSSPAQREPEQETSLLQLNSSKTFPRSAGDQAAQDVSKDSPHLFDDEDSQLERRPATDGSSCDTLGPRQVDDGGLTNVAVPPQEESHSHMSEVKKKAEQQGQVNAESVQDVMSPSPQFCSRHERWVDSILQECPDDCSEELLLHKNTSVSPPLFQSLSSAPSSHDLTPSDLSPCSSVQQHLPPQTSFHHQVSSQTSEQGNSKDTPMSGSAVLRSQREPRPGSQVMSPLVRLVDIASVKGVYQEYRSQRPSPSNFTMSTKEHTPSASTAVIRASPSHRNPTNKDSDSAQTQTVSPSTRTTTTDRRHTLPVSHVPTTSACCPPPASRSSSRLSQKLKQFSGHRHSGSPGLYSQKPLPDSFEKAPPTLQTTSPLSPTESTSCGSQVTPGSKTPVSLFGGHLAKPSSGKVHQVTISVQSQYDLRPCEPQTQPLSMLMFSALNSPSDSVRTSRTTLRLSRQSQAVLLQSKLLQPCVRLTRLDPQDHHMVAKTRSSVPGKVLLEEEDKEESLLDSSFDVAALYSSYSSGSDSEDARDTDPDYKPRIKKKRLFFSCWMWESLSPS
ncbi:uncharacterized protein LOC117515201 isoform X2 [Thalassophryne amazonica]|nr:uncharacterized protein LOC117515201 isoform X2 [Thalassophryne amazonica]